MVDLTNEEIEQIARSYIAQEKGWSQTEYTIVQTDGKDDAGNFVVNARHKDDETLSVPGGGKSVELHIDPNTKRVVRELHFQ